MIDLELEQNKQNQRLANILKVAKQTQQLINQTNQELRKQALNMEQSSVKSESIVVEQLSSIHKEQTNTVVQSLMSFWEYIKANVWKTATKPKKRQRYNAQILEEQVCNNQQDQFQQLCPEPIINQKIEALSSQIDTKMDRLMLQRAQEQEYNTIDQMIEVIKRIKLGNREFDAQMSRQDNMLNQIQKQIDHNTKQISNKRKQLMKFLDNL